MIAKLDMTQGSNTEPLSDISYIAHIQYNAILAIGKWKRTEQQLYYM